MLNYRINLLVGLPQAVGLRITAGFWFTASSCIAIPALTIERSLTDSFSDILFADPPVFVLAQLPGAVVAA